MGPISGWKSQEFLKDNKYKQSHPQKSKNLVELKLTTCTDQ